MMACAHVTPPGRGVRTTDRSILFSGVMVRALLAGRKTQTRRLATSPLARCAIGDRLWVRETWRGRKRMDTYPPRKFTMDRSRIAYVADGPAPACPLGEWEWGKTRVCLHMPRWASRLTLVVTGVRIERLRSISGEDAKAEGLERGCIGGLLPSYRGAPDLDWRLYADDAFRDLWNSLHTADGERWEDDPEVLALTFRVERGNIDAVPLQPNEASR